MCVELPGISVHLSMGTAAMRSSTKSAASQQRLTGGRVVVVVTAFTHVLGRNRWDFKSHCPRGHFTNTIIILFYYYPLYFSSDVKQTKGSFVSPSLELYI